ncbi:recombinase family protein [Thiomicrospira microaerophila]|uniref:recombinase family protein n=1 Tax=Thiomicrospira microaerophila TaxID=406020 RepID=UPI00200F5CBE|nr:recombinase family protein [Thiomicrospira microaerophila]UQB42761.1 recombinase family protein [Thiomicrospira microaerophila]
MANIAYIRVSSENQNTERQTFEGYTLDKTFEEKASARDTQRPQLKACIEFVREGDTLLVYSIDRLARSLQDLNSLIATLTAKGVAVRFIKENLEFKQDKANHVNELMLNILGSIAQFERALIKERQAEGIANAKAKGVYKGRKPALTQNQVLEIQEKIKMGVTMAKLSADYKISRHTVYKIRDGEYILDQIATA